MAAYEMTLWPFAKGRSKHVVSATFAMTEAEARAAAARKGWEVNGWTATKGAQAVTVADDGDGKLYNFTVTYERTQTLVIEVEAHDEDEANELADKERDESSDYDWDSDDDEGTRVETEKGDLVDDDDEKEGLSGFLG